MYRGARNFASKFYHSKRWERASRKYRDAHPLCEKCLAKGIFTPSQLVHHKTHIDENNYRNPDVLLDPSNFEALCRKCHGEEHSDKPKPSEFLEDGSLIL